MAHSYLHTIQAKPEPVRRRILYALIGVSMLMIIVVWLAHMRVTMGPRTATPPAQQSSVFADFKLFIMEVGEAVRSSWGRVQK